MVGAGAQREKVFLVGRELEAVRSSAPLRLCAKQLIPLREFETDWLGG